MTRLISEKESGLTTCGIVVYFRNVVLEKDLLATQEALKIKQLLERSEQGLVFFGETQRRITDALQELAEAAAFDRVLGLLQILHTLSLSEEYRVLSRHGFASSLRSEDQERMEQMCAYVMGHFTEPIRLEEKAKLANMTPTAFCRYLKERTNKSLSQFITELRIGYARRLLAEEDLKISQVAYQCGYPSFSNFNRQFKALSKMTPSAYKQKYAAVMIEPSDAPAPL